MWPLAKLASVAHRQRARIMVGAAQLAPHRAINIAATGIDHVALSGHKLYAPFGAGALAGRANLLTRRGPTWPAVVRPPGSVTRRMTSTGPEGPAQHEAGSPNTVGAVALAAACDDLAAADRTALEAAEEVLVARLHQGAVRGPWCAAADRTRPVAGQGGVRVVCARRAPLPGRRYAARCGVGVGVRDGLLCAHPFTRGLVAQAGSPARSAIRASSGIGSTVKDVARLVAGVAEIVRS